ncbi:MAG TPA: PDZ domain-containing protein, partial [Casimicrobiaceae bacterium]
FGVALHLRAAVHDRDRGGRPADGVAPQCALGARVTNDHTLQHVVPGSAASRAGLSAGDALIAIDGIKASAESLAYILKRREPGDTVTVHAFRRDELLPFAVTLDAAPLDTAVLRLNPAAGADSANRRTAWLGSAE